MSEKWGEEQINADRSDIKTWKGSTETKAAGLSLPSLLLTVCRYLPAESWFSLERVKIAEAVGVGGPFRTEVKEAHFVGSVAGKPTFSTQTSSGRAESAGFFHRNVNPAQQNLVFHVRIKAAKDNQITVILKLGFQQTLTSWRKDSSRNDTDFLFILKA